MDGKISKCWQFNRYFQQVTAWFLLSLNYGSLLPIICNFTQSTKTLDFLAEEQKQRSREPENDDEDTERYSLNQPCNSFRTSGCESVDTVPNYVHRVRTTGPQGPQVAGMGTDLNHPPRALNTDLTLDPKPPGSWTESGAKLKQVNCLQ